MKNKKTPLHVPILWFFITGCWTITFCVELSTNSISGGTVLPRGFMALLSLVVAVMHLIRYLRTKDQE